MRIFIDALSARDGGGVTYINNLFSLLPKNKKIKIYILIQNNFDLKVTDARISVIRGFYLLKNPIVRFFWQVLYLKILLKKLKINKFFAPGGITLTKVTKNCETLILFRNMLPFDKDQLRRYPLSLFKIKLLITKLLILKSLNKASSVIYISNFGKNFISENYSYIKHKYTIIPHGIDKKFYANQKSTKINSLTFGKYILYVSRLEYYKNQLELIKAFNKLIKKINFDLKLILVGPKSTEYGKIILSYLLKYNLSKKVILLGNVHHDELPNLYKNAEINVFLSEVENCPNILLEALASKKPVLCSNKNPMIEFGGDAPFYCNPRDIEEIEERLNTIFSNKNLSKKKAIKGFKRAQLFSKDASISKTWEFLLKEK